MEIPQIILGTSCLGNLYQAVSQQSKTAIIKEFIQQSNGTPVFDTAGKYGAGLALESLGKGLKSLDVHPEDIIISNKLGWYRTELKTPQPLFEKDIWIDIKNDAVQKMGYEGILECYQQGNELLDGYKAQFVSVHDPDEYLAAATDSTDKDKRYKEILSAYTALFDLKKNGTVKAVGVGAKDWRIIQRLVGDIDLDWVMIANSMTVHSHPKELLVFMNGLAQKNVHIINSAVFNGGFLVGSDFYNYRLVDNQTSLGKELLKWREQFYDLCREHGIDPAKAALNFGLHAPGVKSIAISSSNPKRLKETITMATGNVPKSFWQGMLQRGLIADDSILLSSILL